ncbi:hypothetical protein D0T49_02585 [Paludibacter sp. 221]|uniref:hypothetical protein n=1 Tax=Paludibacter sp. 221 TaxID=2302939 RepID=UPI0013D68A3A|nr:hypothetical protein [Paludibacter sp. 221]NDV45933.1 hypothetical protein [Paludibacter sp. 221]
MRITFCICCFCILFFSKAISQNSDFKEGYIISNTNDTIWGYIDFKMDKVNFEKCFFKETQDGNIQTLYPEDIKAYRFTAENKYYVSYRIKLKNIEHHVFLEFLLSGIYNLYYYVNPVTLLDYYFFEDQNGKITSISKRRDMRLNEEVFEDYIYRDILYNLFQEEELKRQIEKLSFTKYGMINLTKEYHDLVCTTDEECIVFENDYKKDRAKFDFSIYGGLNYINLDYKASTPEVPMESFCPMIGGNIKFSYPRWNKSLNLNLDLSLSGISYDSGYQYRTLYYYRCDIKSLIMKEKINIEYVYPKKSIIKPILNVGVGFNHFLNKKSSYDSFHRTTNELLKHRDDFFQTEVVYSCINLGAGLGYSLKNEGMLFLKFSYEQNFSKRTMFFRTTQLYIGYEF